MANKLRSYQKKAVSFLNKHDGGALFLRPGSGKTAIVLTWLKKLFKENPGQKFLLISMLSIIYDAWEYETEKWFPKLKVRNIHRDGYAEGYDLYTINPEKFVSEFKKPPSESNWLRVFTGFIIDESTIIKNYKAPKKVNGETKFHRTHYILRFIDIVDPEYKIIMTGTPVTKNLLDIFSQFYVIDKKLLGYDFWRYRSIFFEPSPDGYGWLPREDAEDEIIKRISKKAFIINTEDEKEIGYPKEIENDIYFTLTDKNYKKYLKFQNDFLLELESIIVDKTKHKGKLYQSAVSYSYMSQFTSGGIYRYENGKKITEIIHDERLKVLKDLLEILDGIPLLVLYHYEFDTVLFKKLKIKNSEYIKGGIKPEKQQQTIKKWNAGKIPVLFCQIQKASHGLNLQYGSNHICYYNVPHDYELVYQSKHRLIRPGNKSDTVTVHRIICRKTVDQIKRLQILNKKIIKVEQVKEMLKEYSK